jgi:type I restriction enzyme M protein
MVAIEKENPKQFRGVLPKIYARSNIDYLTLGEIINLFSTIGFGTEDAIAKDILGRVYEYFIGRFAQQEGKGGGEFYTPRCIVKLLVEMLEPYHGRIFDPACGSGGMFVQSIKFIQAHGGKRGDISIFGQESIDTTWRICKMNLAIRSIAGNIQLGNSYWDDKFKDLRADYILANPPFNVSEWGVDRVQGDVRLKYGTPPNSNANYMWIQHFIYHLAPNGIAGFVMANGSMSVGGVEGEIRRKIIEDDLVDCVIALPVQLFYTTGIPACLWFLTKNKAQKGHRDRNGETLFIDARKLFRKVDRTHNELTDEQIKQIADTYHAYRGEVGLSEYQDIPGFCKVATLEEIRKNGHVLTPGRYVGTEEVEDDGEPFEEKMERLTLELAEQFERSEELKGQIKANLEELGYGV